MIKAERQDKVRQLLEEQGTVSVKEISDALGVSDMTIRRDLEELASLGEIERVHGGAVARRAVHMLCCAMSIAQRKAYQACRGKAADRAPRR